MISVLFGVPTREIDVKAHLSRGGEGWRRRGTGWVGAVARGLAIRAACRLGGLFVQLVQLEVREIKPGADETADEDVVVAGKGTLPHAAGHTRLLGVPTCGRAERHLAVADLKDEDAGPVPEPDLVGGNLMPR